MFTKSVPSKFLFEGGRRLQTDSLTPPFLGAPTNHKETLSLVFLAHIPTVPELSQFT